MSSFQSFVTSLTFESMSELLKDSFVIKYDNDDYSPVIFDVGNKNEFYSILPIL